MHQASGMQCAGSLSTVERMARGAVIAVDIKRECTITVCVCVCVRTHVYTCYLYDYTLTCVAVSSTGMEPLPGVVLLDNNNVTLPETWQKVLEVLRGHQADVVMRWVHDGSSLLIGLCIASTGRTTYVPSAPPPAATWHQMQVVSTS